MDLVALAVILIGLIIAIQVVHSYFFRPQNKLCPKPAVFFPRTNALLNWYNVKHVNAIVDQFKSVQEVGEALQAAGLGTCHLMFGEYRIFSFSMWVYSLAEQPSRSTVMGPWTQCVASIEVIYFYRSWLWHHRTNAYIQASITYVIVLGHMVHALELILACWFCHRRGLLCKQRLPRGKNLWWSKPAHYRRWTGKSLPASR